jgi:hypothetical protein
VVDNPGASGYPGTGIAGETQGWDSIPTDPSSEPNGGASNSFYSGPQFPNGATGCLSFQQGGCAGGVSQGCHVVHVEGWNKTGRSTGDSTYGPLCYDTVAPAVSASQAPAPNSAGWSKQAVTVTLNASDPGGSQASGIKATYYGLGSSACSPTALSACQTYSSPFVFSQEGITGAIFFTEDIAGNISIPLAVTVAIDETAPVTTATVKASPVDVFLNSGAVIVTLTVTDNLSGVASTTYSLDGGASAAYTSPVTVGNNGSHTMSYYSTDAAGNVETPHAITFTIK